MKLHQVEHGSGGNCLMNVLHDFIMMAFESHCYDTSSYYLMCHLRASSWLSLAFFLMCSQRDFNRVDGPTDR